MSMPARSPSTRSSWPATSASRAGSRRSGASRPCSPGCASRPPGAPARPAGSTTPAGAAAWQRSSSPACRWTGRTRSARGVTGRRRSPRWQAPAVRPGPGPPMTTHAAPPVGPWTAGASGRARHREHSELSDLTGRGSMGSGWFESVAEAQRRARRRLPKSVYGALIAGSEKGLTVRDNVRAFSELGFAPHAAGTPSERDLTTTVLGQQVSMPVIISPTGVQAVHPDGEVAVARAAAARGTMMSLSSFASKPLGEVVAANPKTLFQVYWAGDRDSMRQRLDYARAAGAVGIILTLDWTFAWGRDWGSPQIPERMDARTMLRFAPQVLARPRWLAGYARAGKVPDLTVPNMAAPGEAAPTFFGAYREWMATPPPAWDDVAWLAKTWDGQF